MKKRKENSIYLIIGLLILILSAGVALYPSISNYINQKHSESDINEYTEQINTLNEASKDEFLKEAEDFNDELKDQGNDFIPLSESTVSGYNDILSFDSSIIGYIDIPAIDCYLPIRHGTTPGALDKGAVHLPNTAFPIGGLGNHSIITAHTAYVGQIFFDNIIYLVPGDEVYIKILGNTYTYVVVEQNKVLPTDFSKCQPDRNKDLLSLVTCYPYAQNTQRLVVTCERKYVPSATTPAPIKESGTESVAEDDTPSHTISQ